MSAKRKAPKKLFCEHGQHFVEKLVNHSGEVGELTKCAACAMDEILRDQLKRVRKVRRAWP